MYALIVLLVAFAGCVHCEESNGLPASHPPRAVDMPGAAPTPTPPPQAVLQAQVLCSCRQHERSRPCFDRAPLTFGG